MAGKSNRTILKEDLEGGTREMAISPALHHYAAHVCITTTEYGGVGLVLTPQQTVDAIAALQGTLVAHNEREGKATNEPLEAARAAVQRSDESQPSIGAEVRELRAALRALIQHVETAAPREARDA